MKLKPLSEARRAHMLKLQAAKAAANERRRVERVAAVAAGTYACAKCGIAKCAADYPTSRKNRYGEPRFRYCKLCHNDYQRINRLRLAFSLTVADYDSILLFQDGVCAICEKPPSKLRLAVDHDHKTGLIRGLLCAWCNRAIGQFRDDIARVNRTVAYFVSPPCTAALGAPRYGIKGRVTNKAATKRRLNRKPRAIKEAA